MRDLTAIEWLGKAVAAFGAWLCDKRAYDLGEAIKFTREALLVMEEMQEDDGLSGAFKEDRDA